MPFAVNNLLLSILLLTVITVAVYATYGPFWSLPSLFLTGQSAAVGLAAINSLANLGGFVGPFAFGALKDSTGNNNWGLAMVSITCRIAAAMVGPEIRPPGRSHRPLRRRKKPTPKQNSSPQEATRNDRYRKHRPTH